MEWKSVLRGGTLNETKGGPVVPISSLDTIQFRKCFTITDGPRLIYYHLPQPSKLYLPLRFFDNPDH